MTPYGALRRATRPGAPDEAEADGRGRHGSLHLASENHEMVAQEGILGDQRGLCPGQLTDGTTDERPGCGPDPREEGTVGRA